MHILHTCNCMPFFHPWMFFLFTLMNILFILVWEWAIVHCWVSHKLSLHFFFFLRLFLNKLSFIFVGTSLVALVVKSLPVHTEDARDVGSIFESGGSPEGGNGKPTPVFLPGKFHGQRSLMGYSPWGLKESNTTERLNTNSLLPGQALYWNLNELFINASTESLKQAGTLCSGACP